MLKGENMGVNLIGSFGELGETVDLGRAYKYDTTKVDWDILVNKMTNMIMYCPKDYCEACELVNEMYELIDEIEVFGREAVIETLKENGFTFKKE